MRLAAACLTLLTCASTALADPVVESQRLHVRLDPATRLIRGTSELRVSLDGGGVLALELASSLEITSILHDGAPVERIVDSERGDGITVWRFPVPATDGAERAVVSVSWTGAFLPPPGAKFSQTTIDLPASARWAPTPTTHVTWWMQLDVPEALRCVLRGERIERNISNARATETWATDLPALGLPLAAGTWTPQEAEASGGTVVVWSKGAPDEVLLRDTVAAFDAVTAVLGPCPGSPFQILPDDAPLASVTPGFGARLWGDLTTQAARCWWGHGVPETAARGTWTEALAAYTARHLSVEGEDPAAARAFREQLASGLSESTAATDSRRQVFAFHALREEIGAEAFRTALRSVAAQRRGEPTSWADWTRAFSAATGRDLTARVAQWTERPGAPLLELTGLSLTTVGGRLRLAGTIKQSVGADEAPWRLTVPVVVELPGDRLTIDVEVGGSATGFSEILPALPLRATLDPDVNVPRRLSRDGEHLLSNSRALMPDVDAAADPRRVGMLLDRLAAQDDQKAMRQAILDELRIAGLDAKELRSEITVRARATDEVIASNGAAIPGCHPLTCSAATADDGVLVTGLAFDEFDDLSGKALLVDVPGSTLDLPAFARGIAGIARDAGARALLLRVSNHPMNQMNPYWATPAEAPDGHADPVLFAASSQVSRGPDLALPTLIVPEGFAPEGAFRVTVRWEEITTSVASVVARVSAPHGRGAPILLSATAGPGEDASAAAALAEAAQLLQPHAALLGRDIVLSILPSGAAATAASDALRLQLGGPPAVLFVVARVGDAGVDAVEIRATEAAKQLARRTVFACDRTGLVAAVNEQDELLARDANDRTIVVRSVSTSPDASPDASKVTRIARYVALMALDASVAP